MSIECDQMEITIERDRMEMAIEPIKRIRIIAIRLWNAIEWQSNGRFMGNIRLRLIWILRSIAFD